MDKRDKIKQKITEKLREVFQNDGMVKGSLVIDRRHDFFVSVEDPSLDFWDDDTLDQIQEIIDNSPKSAVRDIIFYFDKRSVLIIVRPLRDDTFWISRYEWKSRLAPPLPYEKWCRELVKLLEILD